MLEQYLEPSEDVKKLVTKVEVGHYVHAINIPPATRKAAYKRGAENSGNHFLYWDFGIAQDERPPEAKKKCGVVR